MTERPILFSAPMVRAILDGRKTQTRRVIAPQPVPPVMPVESYNDGRLEIVFGPNCRKADGTPRWYRPPAQVGDTLYVREAWQAADFYDDMPPRDIPATACVSYLADGDVNGSTDEDDLELIQQGDWGRKRIGMHMPRWASRIVLTVTDVRVQRLADISEDDAVAEGIDWVRAYGMPSVGGWRHYGKDDCGLSDPTVSFRTLWDSLNEPRGYGWKANPWVVAMTFERAEP